MTDLNLGSIARRPTRSGTASSSSCARTRSSAPDPRVGESVGEIDEDVACAAFDTYFVGREHFLPTGPGKVARWRKRLFEVLSRNVPPATDAFGIPPGRVVELGAQVAL